MTDLMLHIFRLCENIDEFSSEEHIVIAPSMEDAKGIILAASPDAEFYEGLCQDWGEVTVGEKGSISTGD